MTDRFEMLTKGSAGIYKSIQTLKKYTMRSMGMKGTHVMCLYYLGQNEDGLTAAELCDLCKEDKAGISRILSELEEGGYIVYEDGESENRRYRARARLTEQGRSNCEKLLRCITYATELGGLKLSDEDRETFYRVLDLINRNLEAACDIFKENMSSDQL